MMKRTLQLLCLLPALTAFPAQVPGDGNKFLYYQRYASAENVFHDYLRQQPLDGEGWLLLIKSYILQNEPRKAADSLALAPASLNEDPYYLIARGTIYLSNKQTDSARYFFEKSIDDTKGKNPSVLSAVADMEIISENGNISYSLELLQKALKKDKNNAYLYVLMGNAYHKLGNGTEAFKAYQNAIEKDKNLAEAYYRMGEIFVSQKNEELYLDYFTKAAGADPNYGPALLRLYQYYVYTKPDPEKAMQYFHRYTNASDKTIRTDYSYTDLLYLTKDYPNAIAKAKELINREGDKVQPRLYKLVAYSYGELKDTTHAVDYMREYFHKEKDSNFIAKDFEMMAQLYAGENYPTDSAIAYFQKAAAISRDSTLFFKHCKDLANVAAAKKDYLSQAKWLGLYYSGNDKATNVDLFNWGIAAYRTNNYLLADSVFGLYTVKYPDQRFGYYWRARSNAGIDTAMAKGLAIPYYNKLLEMINKDSLTATDKKWMMEAYGYMAAYETNTLKDYGKAIEYFDKLLEVDPENANAKKYIPILKANMKKESGDN